VALTEHGGSGGHVFLLFCLRVLYSPPPKRQRLNCYPRQKCKTGTGFVDRATETTRSRFRSWKGNISSLARGSLSSTLGLGKKGGSVLQRGGFRFFAFLGCWAILTGIRPALAPHRRIARPSSHGVLGGYPRKCGQMGSGVRLSVVREWMASRVRGGI